VLVVDDDPLIRKAVRLTCESAGFAVQEEEHGSEVPARIEAFHPDVVLLDLMLPDMNGFDVCKEVRRAGHRVPVLILSARNEEIDVVLGLEIGADDYIQKPFRPRELLARIGAHLRKARESGTTETNGQGARLVFKGLVIDLPERRVLRGDIPVPLTHTEFDLLAYLATNAGKALSRERIFSSVWGITHPIETRVIDVHVRNLRRKIEEDPAHPQFILAVPSIGYRFAAVKP
jgi:DNA-binding response OmpR family regulator